MTEIYVCSLRSPTTKRLMETCSEASPTTKRLMDRCKFTCLPSRSVTQRVGNLQAGASRFTPPLSPSGSVTALRVEKRLEREAYQAIKREAERFLVIDSAKSERVFSKRYEQWVEATYVMEKQIDVYEMYRWLVGELRVGLEFVSAESGLLQI